MGHQVSTCGKEVLGGSCVSEEIKIKPSRKLTPNFQVFASQNHVGAAHPPTATRSLNPKGLGFRVNSATQTQLDGIPSLSSLTFGNCFFGAWIPHLSKCFHGSNLLSPLWGNPYTLRHPHQPIRSTCTPKVCEVMASWLVLLGFRLLVCLL